MNSLATAAQSFADTANFADWLDALRHNDASGASFASDATLSPELLSRLGDCARAYEKQSAQPDGRRQRVALFVRGASRAEGQAIAGFFANRLGLRIATIDSKDVEGAHEDAALEAIRPLVEHTPRVALVEGLKHGADARLCDALAWSSRDVLVVACGAMGETLDGRLLKAFDFVVDCRVKGRTTLPFFSALRV